MPARAGKAFQHRALGGLLVEVHRLRVEFAREFEDFLAAHAARTERAETAGFEVFEGQRGHGEKCRKEARLWPLFAAISTRRYAWRVSVPIRRACPRRYSGLGQRPNSTRPNLPSGWGKTDVRFSGPVSVGPFHHAHYHQDVLLAGDRPDRAVRHLRRLLGVSCD